MTKELGEKFVSDDGYSTVADAVDGAGGPIKARKGDVKKAVNPTADKVAGEVGGPKHTDARKTVTTSESEEVEGETVAEEVVEIDESVAALFEGEELSEDFKKKASLIFTAAINEAVTTQVAEATEALKEQFDAQLTESVNEAMEEIVESLDGYLNLVVTEWMAENEIAIEAGIKVEMAESMLEGLKGLFYEHNIAIDEETIDVVGGLEEELAAAVAATNDKINENIALMSELAALKAEKVFAEVTEGLTVTQVERLRVLSEKINHDDLTTYAADLNTLKESFFKIGSTEKAPLVESVAAEEEGEIITEETAPVRASVNPQISAYAAAFTARAKK